MFAMIVLAGCATSPGRVGPLEACRFQGDVNEIFEEVAASPFGQTARGKKLTKILVDMNRRGLIGFRPYGHPDLGEAFIDSKILHEGDGPRLLVAVSPHLHRGWSKRARRRAASEHFYFSGRYMADKLGTANNLFYQAVFILRAEVPSWVVEKSIDAELAGLAAECALSPERKEEMPLRLEGIRGKMKHDAGFIPPASDSNYVPVGGKTLEYWLRSLRASPAE